jgi:hypothetical protein
MTLFFLTFGLLLCVTAAMAVGAMLMGKRITGSCGGLNAIAGTDKCVVCKLPVDPDSPLRDRMACPRARKMAARMAAEEGA